jgi:hypothetical protein
MFFVFFSYSFARMDENFFVVSDRYIRKLSLKKYRKKEEKCFYYYLYLFFVCYKCKQIPISIIVRINNI